ncbi:hypothetical protein, partial [uncultured Duncaniella sp.]|uniref:hypothetical protein n=1 Tax=uncultured Duncaniella sp. TaxID=2768039 RepID=UPI0025A54963
MRDSDSASHDKETMAPSGNDNVRRDVECGRGRVRPAAAPGAHKRRAPGILVLGAREGAVIYFPAFAV